MQGMWDATMDVICPAVKFLLYVSDDQSQRMKQLTNDSLRKWRLSGRQLMSY